MAIYVGEAVAIRAQATHPFTKDQITDLTGSVDVYDPSKDPKASPTDRSAPNATATMTYDAASEGYVAFVLTTGFVPGKWTYRVHLTGGGFDNFEFGTFTLKE